MMHRPGPDMQQRAALFDQLPSAILLLDRDMRIVDHNTTFGETFGESLGMHCWERFKQQDEPCENCLWRRVFEDGRECVLEETAVDNLGQRLNCTVQVSPVYNGNNEVTRIAAIMTDQTATRRLQQEYQVLFDTVPCFVTVINSDFRVVRANNMFREVFGEPRGEHCYQLFKKRHKKCENCPAELTFRDGAHHTEHHTGLSHENVPTQYVVSTAPLPGGSDGEVSHVIEMCLDVTATAHLEKELTRANMLREALVENSLDAIVVLDADRKVVLMNGMAEDLWNISRDRGLGRRIRNRMMPPSLNRLLSGEQENAVLLKTNIVTMDNEEVPVRLAGVSLRDGPEVIGVAVIAQDLRQIRQMEQDRREAERMAAVGRTVAGLAHGIKNILTGIEGGMYVTSSGLKKNDTDRIDRGWAMLERNIGHITDLTKNLLAFSRGDQPKPSLVDPAEIVRDVVSLYAEHAAQQDTTLTAEIADGIAEAMLDGDGIHRCLADLISNAVDACRASRREARSVRVRLFEEDETLVFKIVDDGCGMDSAVKQKAFTSFFTTKGAGGSGLGLLMTQKIVQQHGGKIEVESEPSVGSTFTIRLERSRLPEPEAEDEKN